MRHLCIIFGLFCYLIEHNEALNYVPLAVRHHHSEHPTLKIIGGEIAVPHAVPHLVAIWVKGDDGGDAFCGGSLLTRKHILTAASCLDDGRTISVMIFGAHNRNRFSVEQQRRYVGDIVIHEDHNMYNRTHDIAFIVLREPIKVTTYVKPALLPDAKDANATFVGENVQAFGWGWTHDADRFVESDLLMTVNLTVISNADCAREFRRADYPFLYDYELCTSGDNTVGTCTGDTGSPLMLNGIMIALATQGTGYCELGRPSKFVSVGQHLEWIQNKIKAL